MAVISVNKLSITFFIVFFFLAGCTNNEEGKIPSSFTASTQPSASIAAYSPPTTENDETRQPITNFLSKSQEKQLSIYENMNSTSPLTAQITDKSGNTDNRSNVPIQKDWEKGVQKDNVFTSIHSASDINWILFTSDPGLGIMGKTVYKTRDNGKSWVFVNDVSLIVDGYVTGLSFRDEKNGWISATQHGTALLPLYRTKDGGASWIIQKMDIPEGYNYGNAYPPIFDDKDNMQGKIKIEFVSESDKKTVEFKTTDGGETWKF
jgi:hypothetical protein